MTRLVVQLVIRRRFSSLLQIYSASFLSDPSHTSSPRLSNTFVMISPSTFIYIAITLLHGKQNDSKALGARDGRIKRPRKNASISLAITIHHQLVASKAIKGSGSRLSKSPIIQNIKPELIDRIASYHTNVTVLNLPCIIPSQCDT